MNSTEKNILFVCMGNICRSPAGEAVLQKMLRDQHLESKIKLDSAGTHAYHVGELPDPRMRSAGQKRGYEFETRARKITRDDLHEFDLIVAMDRDNLKRIIALDSNPSAEIRLLSDFLVGEGWSIDVPDPYYGGITGFETVLDMIEAACPNIIAHISQRHGDDA